MCSDCTYIMISMTSLVRCGTICQLQIYYTASAILNVELRTPQNIVHSSACRFENKVLLAIGSACKNLKILSCVSQTIDLVTLKRPAGAWLVGIPISNVIYSAFWWVTFVYIEGGRARAAREWERQKRLCSPGSCQGWREVNLQDLQAFNVWAHACVQHIDSMSVQ